MVTDERFLMPSCNLPANENVPLIDRAAVENRRVLPHWTWIASFNNTIGKWNRVDFLKKIDVFLNASYIQIQEHPLETLK